VRGKGDGGTSPHGTRAVKGVEVRREVLRLPPLSARLALAAQPRLLLIWPLSSLFPYPRYFAQTSAEHERKMPPFHSFLIFLLLASWGQERNRGRETQPYALVPFKLSSLLNRKVMNCLLFLLLFSKC